MLHFCCDQRRRDTVRAHPTLNGIDYLEVLDQDAPVGSPRQRSLLVRWLKAIPEFTRENVQLEGGERITPVRVVWAYRADRIPATELTPPEQAFFAALPEADRVLVVRTDSTGDFSTYRLSLRASEAILIPRDRFDPRLLAVDFSFKVECPSEFDCQRDRLCPPGPQPQPELDYLAKDYTSFRQLMLDRMAVLLPQWKERNPADIGITLVELLAYVGDHLSYQQDVIATEAYLGTAQRRTSVRRHARLVDYVMHDGCNARVWVQVQVSQDTLLPSSTQVLTRVEGATEKIVPGSTAYQRILAQRPEVFETLHESLLLAAHNQLFFYTWGDRDCCLPRGATRATLRDDPAQRLQLRAGDVLILIETKGSETGAEADADRTHRHAVRLTRVEPAAIQVVDGRPTWTAGPLLTDPLTGTAIVEIEWHRDDALPVPFCISATTDADYGQQFVQDVSVALGNIVLADHGQTLPVEELGQVPEPILFPALVSIEDRCQKSTPEPIPPRFNPHLQEAPLTQAATVTKEIGDRAVRLPFDPDASATAAFQWSLRDALPALTLNNGTWFPQRDLLSSNQFDLNFVAEVEANGQTSLRFGDDRHGLRPNVGTLFTAVYRVGNGVAGNIGAEALAHIVTGDGAIDRVWNPLPARGGIQPESIAAVRQQAPTAFRTQERAVTADDYARVAERHPQVQRAAATFRWTGSWRTVFVTVDRLGGLPVDAAFKREMLRHLERYRMAGYDLAVDAPRFVSLEMEMQVCVKPNYFRSDVKAALLQVFSNRILPDGRRGVFHPDHFTFGQPVYLSPLYAAAQAVAGVESATITLFQRQGTPDNDALERGWLELGRLEIARLDNDPNFRERGVLQLRLGGGK
ncbi:MAG: putative baseplate assembly protein [Leptolyngbyaceae cyanobacterium RU_5_1]|nr:putative baseplate assembly protein [Leptolyngbyaceae cyanobacterium RU_5_1]